MINKISENHAIVKEGDFDSTTEFLKGAILAYCQTHEPDDVGGLFNDAFKLLPQDKACKIAGSITSKMLLICITKEDK